MRCFLGSLLEPNDRRKVQALKASFADHDVRWVAPAKFHLTLQFLGNDVVEEDIAKYQDQLTIWRDAFPFTCGGVSLSGFPDSRQARVLVLLLHSEGRLEALRPAQRSFLPHITIGYARRKAIDLPVFSADVKLTIPTPSLFESRNGEYRVLEPTAR